MTRSRVQGNCFKFYIWVTKVHYLPQRTQSSRRKESLFLFLCVLRVLCGSKKLLTDSPNFEAITLPVHTEALELLP
jgi:hypothetical protein